VEIKGLASLNPLHALALIIISMFLTFVAGLIPSRIAAKKDPVIALRSE
jgi:putative ABC transport system permease protein